MPFCRFLSTFVPFFVTLQKALCCFYWLVFLFFSFLFFSFCHLTKSNEKREKALFCLVLKKFQLVIFWLVCCLLACLLFVTLQNAQKYKNGFKRVLKPFERFLCFMLVMVFKSFFLAILRLLLFVTLQKALCFFASFASFVFLFFALKPCFKRFCVFSLFCFLSPYKMRKRL